MKDLISIVDEELDIISDDPDAHTTDVQAMRRALLKLKEGNRDLTEPEKEAVKYALEDVGELYLYAGTSAGFDADNVDSVPEAQRMARNAREQAHQLGIQL